jgi:DNA-binding NarL/FixJ family response regulator
MEEITLLLADDHTILRQGVRSLLQTQSDFRIVGEASSGLETIKKVEMLKPDVVILDLMMHKINELSTIKQIKERHPDTVVVVLSMHDKEAYVLEAMHNGASAYVLKGSDAQDLIVAIRQAKQGNRYLSPPLSERAIDAYVAKSQQADLDPYDKLTSRQREVLLLLAQGFSYAEIAERLGISARTVETHRRRVMEILELGSNTDLIRYAIRLASAGESYLAEATPKLRDFPALNTGKPVL